MTLIPLGYGEFTTTDKLQSSDYIESRAQALRDLYGAHPEATRKLISMLYPHERDRPWEPQELEARIKYVRPEVQKVAEEFVLSSMFPNVSAALQAYQASKAQQDAAEYAANAAKFPALYSTQPQMVAMQQQQGVLGGYGDTPAPVHHRRHRHHY